MNASFDQKLNVCMLLPLLYKPDMLVYPSINVLSNITQFGHQVTWIISSEVHVKPARFELNGVEVFATPYRKYFSGESICAKVFNHLIHSCQKINFTLMVFAQGKFNLIFVRNDVFYGLAASYIKRRYDVPFVFELSVPLEMEWEEYKILRKKPLCFYYLIAKFNKVIKLHLIHRANLVLPISKWLKQDFVNNKGIEESKLMPFSDGVDIAAFSKADRMQVITAHQLSNFKVIVYAGILAKIRNMSILLQAFHIVSRIRKDVKLLVVGDGDDLEKLRQLADELEIQDDVIFTGRVPQSEVPGFLAAADMGVSPIPPNAYYKLSSPIKMVEYMAAGKPVVANQEILEHDEVLQESQCGILIPYTAEAFAEAILKLLDEPDTAKQMGQRGKEWVATNRSHEVMARQVEEKYLELLTSKA